MDRGAVVFTDFTSSEAIEAEFSSQLRRLRFDVEGLAQGLDLAGPSVIIDSVKGAYNT